MQKTLFVKKILIATGLWKPIKIFRRYRFARKHYEMQLKMARSWAFSNNEDSNFYYDLDELNIEHMLHAVSVATGTEIDKIEAYFDEIRNDTWLKDLIYENLKSSSYAQDIKIEFSRRIGWYAFVRAEKPLVVVETGVHNGVGACVIARALMKNNEEGVLGEYFGTDIDRSAGQLFKSPLTEYGQILFGDSLESLGKLNRSIDLFINDSDHSADYEEQEYDLVRDKLSPRAVILGDNSHVTNRLSKFSLENKRHFIFIPEKPKNHWYPGAGIGVSYPKSK